MPSTTADRARWGRELALWWDYYNTLYAEGRMRPPVVRVSVVATEHLGTWQASTRTLTIAATHIESASWMQVMETLRHEMAHQYADEVLGAADETPHGPSFRRAAAILRADSSAADAGQPSSYAAMSGETAPSRIARRVQKLLSLGDSPNQNEAEAALAKARELLLRYNVDTVADGDPAAYGVRWLGPVKQRHPLWEQLLAGLLAEFFFVQVIWVHTYDARRQTSGSVLEMAGTESNLQMADYVYGYLTHVVEQLWNEYRARRGLRGNRERMRFYAGVLRGFAETMRARDRSLRTEHALVWRGDGALTAWLRRRHPHTRTGSVGATTATQAYRDGVEQGRKVELRRPLRGDGDSRIAGYLGG